MRPLRRIKNLRGLLQKLFLKYERNHNHDLQTLEYVL